MDQQYPGVVTFFGPLLQVLHVPEIVEGRLVYSSINLYKLHRKGY